MVQVPASKLFAGREDRSLTLAPKENAAELELRGASVISFPLHARRKLGGLDSERNLAKVHMFTAVEAFKHKETYKDEIFCSLPIVNGLLSALATLSKPVTRDGAASDHCYSDAILWQALSRLCGALPNATADDRDLIEAIASQIEKCHWLSARCREHAAGALREAALDTSKLPLAAAIIDAVVQMLALRALQDMAREGFDNLADAISSLRPDDAMGATQE